VAQLKSVPVPSRSMLVPVILLSLAVAPAPAGSQRRDCAGPGILDPDIRASFARFDRTQSATAALACAILLNISTPRREASLGETEARGLTSPGSPMLIAGSTSGTAWHAGDDVASAWRTGHGRTGSTRQAPLAP
jgi:hypothetical protein